MRLGTALGFVLGAIVAGALALPAPARADNVRDDSWQLDALKISQVHRTTQGKGVVVAVIDTGVDANHQDIKGNVLAGVDLTDSKNANRGQHDSTGHGTAMSSLIAGHGHGSGGRSGVLGIAPKAKILPLSVAGSSGQIQAALIGRAIRLAVDRGADVICVAISGSFQADQRAAVQYAADHDVVVVAGVGNSPDVMVGDPAAIPLALAVSGYDRGGDVATTVTGLPNRQIDVAAPAGDIVAAQPGNKYGIGTGTSNATAIVAGALALVVAKHPGISRNEQVERVVFTAHDIGKPGYDDVFGWGALDVAEAVSGTPHRPTTASASSASAAPGADGDGIDGGDGAGGDADGGSGGLAGGSGGGAGLAVAVAAGVALMLILVIAGVVLRRRARRP